MYCRVSARVFAPTTPQARFNLEDAGRFGGIVYALEAAPSAFATDELMEHFASVLETFDPEIDCIAMTGKNIELALFVAVALQLHGEVRALLYDARGSEYQERMLRRVGATGAREAR